MSEIRLETWDGPWADDDPDANFKAEVALYSKVDPMATLLPFAEAVGIPVGAVCRYVLSRWATEGSGGLLELGPRMAERLGEACDKADEVGTDEARLDAYRQLRDIISWLRLPLS